MQASDLIHAIVLSYFFGFIVVSVVADGSTINGMMDKVLVDEEGGLYMTHPIDDRIKIYMTRDAEVRKNRRKGMSKIQTPRYVIFRYLV